MAVSIGTILMFAGEFDETTLQSLSTKGWLPCNGASYSCKSDSPYYPLFQVIGVAYGYNGTLFNVPDYRGLFLRGVSGSSKMDIDADSRTAQATGGNTGNNVGSMQSDQFLSHQHEYHKLGDTHKVDTISGNKSVNKSSDSTPMSSYGGSETRPINQYVNYMIKFSNATDDIPVGSVVSYGGEKEGVKPPGDNWLFCDGTALSQTTYSALFQQIKYDYGGYSAVGDFCLPDYRGLFLRGVQGDRPADQGDPDAESRTSPESGSADVKGNSGNKVGSFQDYELRAHTHNYDFNKDAKSTAKTAVGFRAVSANSGEDTKDSGQQPTRTDGGSEGSETRPVNMNLNFLIKSA